MSTAPVATTATEWGTILDSPPTEMPRFPAARDATPGEAATATLTTASSVAQVIAWYETEMAAAGYDPAATSRPLEDGSVVAEYDGDAIADGCRAQITARPRGSETLIVVLVAAACGSA